MRNLGCEVGTSFDVCAVQPLDCIVRKAWNAHAVQVEPLFETVDTRFTFPSGHAITSTLASTNTVDTMTI